MILQEIISEIKTADKPVAKMLRRGKDFNVLAIGLREGVELKKHKTDIPARLIVLRGAVVYNNEKEAFALDQYDEHEIPVDEIHWVKSKKDSLFIVIKGEI